MIATIRSLVNLALRMAPYLVIFVVCAAVPPAIVWVATRGPGAAERIPFESTHGSEARRAQQRRDLDQWIDRGVARYLSAPSSR
jgi:hypothetical protein